MFDFGIMCICRWVVLGVRFVSILGFWLMCGWVFILVFVCLGWLLSLLSVLFNLIYVVLIGVVCLFVCLFWC